MRQKRLPVDRYRLAALLALVMLLPALTGCSGQDPDTTADQPPAVESAGVLPETPDEPEPEPVSEPDPLADALEQYRATVSRADTYDYSSIDDPTGVYRYALVRMIPGASVPALLLEQETTFGISNILVFQYDADSETVLQASTVLQEGAAGAGGYRGGLSAAGDGNGLLSTELSSGNGQGSTSRVTLDGDMLQSEILWQGNAFEDIDPTSDEIGFLEIGWHDSGDTSALDGWTPDAAPAGSTPAEPEDTTPAGTVPLTDGDRIVFTGTLGSYSYSEVLSLQGISDPNPGSDRGETYWLIVLDTPQNMFLCSAGDPDGYEGEVRIINVTRAGGLEQYDGQHLSFSIDANNSWWPSDTSLPIGQPNTADIHVLG